MKKYISILAVALVALFATSCKLEDGSESNPNRANNLLWNRVSEAINEQYQHIMVVAELNDILRGAEYGNKPYKTLADITEAEGVYTISFGDERTYRIVTARELLEEGATWVIYVKYGSYMQFAKLGTVTGAVGEPTKFTIALDAEYGYHTAYYNVVTSVVEYSYDSISECLNITFEEVEGYSTDHSSSSTPDYIIHFYSAKPMVFNGGMLYSGEMEILYKDNVLHTERVLKVVIENKFITFA